VELSHISMVETEVTSQPKWRNQDGGAHVASSRWRRPNGGVKMATLRWRPSYVSQAGSERFDGRRRNDSEQSATLAFSPRKQAGLRAGPQATRWAATASANDRWR
jgi:hypothetical protein